MKNFKLIVLHGYGSSSKSDKVVELGKIFDVYAPDIPVKYDEALAYLVKYCSDLKDGNSELIILGTSLGGYWANKIAEMLSIPVVLINPCCDPAKTINDLQNDSSFAFYKGERLDAIELSKYKPLNPGKIIPRVVMLAKDDELFDYSVAQEKFKSTSDVVVFNDGGHRFNCINRITDCVNDLYNSYFYLP